MSKVDRLSTGLVRTSLQPPIQPQSWQRRWILAVHVRPDRQGAPREPDRRLCCARLFRSALQPGLAPRQAVGHEGDLHEQVRQFLVGQSKASRQALLVAYEVVRPPKLEQVTEPDLELRLAPKVATDRLVSKNIAIQAVCIWTSGICAVRGIW